MSRNLSNVDDFGRPSSPHRLASIALLAALGYTGCFSTPPVEEYYYLLTAPQTAPAVSRGPKLAIGHLGAAPGYVGQRIAYRKVNKRRSEELRYYGYRRWAAEPVQLVGEAILRHLRASGRFGDVDSEERVQSPDGVLEATIDAMEELDQGDNKTFGRLAMTLVLRDGGSDAVLLRYSFDRQKTCEQRHPEAVARAISEILSTEMAGLRVRIANALRHR